MGTQTPSMLLIPLLASLTAVPAGGALADRVSHDTSVVAHEVSPDPMRRKQILHYWTLDRMGRAITPARPVHPARPRSRRGGTRHRPSAAARRPARAATPSATSVGAA